MVYDWIGSLMAAGLIRWATRINVGSRSLLIPVRAVASGGMIGVTGLGIGWNYYFRIFHITFTQGVIKARR